MRFEYLKHNWVRHTYEKKLPDLLHLLPALLFAAGLGLIIGSVATAYKTVGEGSFSAAYLAAFAFFAAFFGLWSGITSFRRKEKKWFSIVCLAGNGAVFLTTLILYGMGL